MSEPVTIHVYKASGPEREYTFIFGTDPGQEGAEAFLRSFEDTEIWIADRFPLFRGNVLEQFRGIREDKSFNYDLTVVGGKIIAAGTPIKFVTHTDILWSPVEDDYEQGIEN